MRADHVVWLTGIAEGVPAWKLECTHDWECHVRSWWDEQGIELVHIPCIQRQGIPVVTRWISDDTPVLLELLESPRDTDPISDALADIGDLLDTPIEDRGHADTHYRLLSIAAKLRAAKDRDPRGASHAEEATVHSPLPTPWVTPRHISALWQVEGELRGASGLIFRTGSATLIEDVGGLFDLLTTNADRLEGVLNEVSGGHDRTNQQPKGATNE